MSNFKGGWDPYQTSTIKHKTILSFNFETEGWNEEGNMLVARGAHDVTVVDSEDYMKWCTTTTTTTPTTTSSMYSTPVHSIIQHYASTMKN